MSAFGNISPAIVLYEPTGTRAPEVKAPSTPAVAADQALVVTVSPNNSVAVTLAPVGTQGNAWNAAAVGAGGTSAAIDCQYTPFLSFFGNTSGGTVLTVQLSQDNVSFYDSTTQSVSGDFGWHLTVGARYVRLKNGTARTITATIAGKG